MAETRAITLRRAVIQSANHWYLHGFRLRIDVINAVDMDENVFVYLQRPPEAETGNIINTFETVASFVDLSAYPVGAPNQITEFPFFRLNYIDLDVRSLSQCDEIWKSVTEQVCQLREALNRADQLTLVEEVQCEGPTDLPVSDELLTSETSGESETTTVVDSSYFNNYFF